jgi:RNA polymerase sigma factor (sigma-70 family)
LKPEETNQPDTGLASYYKEIQRMQVDLSPEKENQLVVRYDELRKEQHRLLLSNEHALRRLQHLFTIRNEDSKSVAKMLRSFNSKLKGHNAKLAGDLEHAFASGYSDAFDSISFAYWVYEDLYRHAFSNSDKLEAVRSEMREIEDTLVRSVLMAALNVARRRATGVFGVSIKDAVQKANIEMLEAVRAYDPNKGVKFVTYAYSRAEGKVTELIMEQSRLIHLPRHKLDIIFLVVEASQRTVSEDVEDILEQCNIIRDKKSQSHVDQAAVEEALELMQGNAISLKAKHPTSTDQSKSLEDFLADDKPTPEEALIEYNSRQVLLEKLAECLQPKYLAVIKGRYFQEDKPLSYQEIGDRIQISRTQAKTIEKLALEKLKQIPDLREILKGLQ